MIKTIRKGIEVFEDKEKFRNWLCTPSIALGGAMPISYDWETIYGQLVRIEYGIYS